MISTLDDKEKHIPAQKKCVHENFELFWNAIEKALVKLRQCEFYEGVHLMQGTLWNCMLHSTVWIMERI